MTSAADRARQYINDVLAINTEHGMRSVTTPAALNAALANATRQAHQFEHPTTRSPR